MILNHKKSANGYYGFPVNIKESAKWTWAFSPESVNSASIKRNLDQNMDESDKYFGVCRNYGSLSFFGIDELLGTRWALCSYSGNDFKGYDDNGNIKNGNYINNQFCYILESRIDFSSMTNNIPKTLMKIGDNGLITLELGGSEHLGAACIASRDTYLLSAEDVLFDACQSFSMNHGSDRIGDRKDHTGTKVGKYSMFSMVLSNNHTVWDTISVKAPNGSETSQAYLVVIHDGKYKYVRNNDVKSSFETSEPILAIWNEQYTKNNRVNEDVVVSLETVTLKNETCILNIEQCKKYTGSHETNIEAKNYMGLKPTKSKVDVTASEIINNKKFLLVPFGGSGGIANYYIPYDSIEEKGQLSPFMSTISKKDFEFNTEPVKVSNILEKSSTTSNKSTSYSKTENSKSKELNSDTDSDLYKWYDTVLPVNKHPNEEDMKLTGAAYLDSEPDNKLPSGWGDPYLLGETNYYNLDRYTPRFLSSDKGGHADKRQISKINRFKFITDQSGLSTKSFIFMTKPDLNIYKSDDNGNIVPGQMNPDLIRFPVFKYIGRNKDVGYDILDSLEYWGTGSGDTPWLSIITNQSEGYSPIDRDIEYSEVGETFHGHKVLYGKHSFKHNAAGTVTIPFNERRDLSLYYTLKIWTEYIHLINLGFVEPRRIHVANSELDYAVSLYYIQTDETMENILYWEKLTGVFPLKCPDSFFEWSKGQNAKNMEYDIEFAYSMRSVLNTSDLYEIDTLYKKGSEFVYPNDIPNKLTSADYYNNPYIAKMAAYFGNTRTDIKNEFGQRTYSSNPLTPDSDDFNNFVNNLINGASDILQYYYEPFDDGLGNIVNFLPNYDPTIQSHGIPYVKGPFIMPHPEYNGGKFLLKWV